MITIKWPGVLAVSISLLYSAQLMSETDCSREAIGYYLEKGFTPEQVSRMCQDTAAAISGSANDAGSMQEAVDVSSQSVALVDNNEQVFFNKTILSDSLNVTPQTLTYIRDQCINYGEEDTMTGFRPKICGVIKTTINRVGLKVLRAVKSLSIFRDAELLVEGQIQREVVNLERMSSADRKIFNKILNPAPVTINIETREDADPKKVAARLPK